MAGAGDEDAVSFVGAGRVGMSLARLLRERGYAIDTLVCRSPERAKAAVAFVGEGVPATEAARALTSAFVFLTVPDDAVGAVCGDLAPGWQARHTVVHCSGVLGIDVLAPAAAAGAAVLALHPLEAVPHPDVGIKALPGAFFGLEGCPRGMRLGRRIVDALGGQVLAVSPGGKAAYHAAAAVASNYLVTLCDVALTLMESAGVARHAALPALLRLMTGTLSNIETQGIPEALTGPIERGDAATVVRHLEALAGQAELREIYQMLGRRTLLLAERKRPQMQAQLQAVAPLLVRRAESP
jgi:predicted short-subunit dehydrogenase-like oxidoreductase (DUF2520 family)